MIPFRCPMCKWDVLVMVQEEATVIGRLDATYPGGRSLPEVEEVELSVYTQKPVRFQCHNCKFPIPAANLTELRDWLLDNGFLEVRE